MFKYIHILTPLDMMLSLEAECLVWGNETLLLVAESQLYNPIPLTEESLEVLFPYADKEDR